MRYVIVYLIKGKPMIYQIKLINEISKKFKVKNLNYHIMPHITLKTPIITKNISIFEEKIREFCKFSNKGLIEIRGFGDFYNHVIFLKIILSSQAKSSRKKLIKKLMEIPRLKLDKFDKSYKPHATLCYIKNKSKSLEIKNYLSNKKPRYKFKFDNITILKKVKNKWIIHKEFKIR